MEEKKPEMEAPTGVSIPTGGGEGGIPPSRGSASIPAKAGTHGWRNVVEARTFDSSQLSTLMRPTRGNPTIQIPPLYYNPTEHTGWVYIVANKPNGVIYIGQTTNLPERTFQHRQGKIPGYSQTHACKTLVYFEGYAKITESIERETVMKEWHRKWKIRRILETNPTWRDLYAEICEIR